MLRMEDFVAWLHTKAFIRLSFVEYNVSFFSLLLQALPSVAVAAMVDLVVERWVLKVTSPLIAL